MASDLSAASELANLLNNSYNGSYALASTAEPQYGMCPAVTRCLASDRPTFEEPGSGLREATSADFVLCCILVTLILFMAVVDLILIAFTVVLAICFMVKKSFGQTHENENNNDNEIDAVPALQALPVPSQEDSRSPKGDQLPNRRHRRQRRSTLPTPPPPQTPPPPPPSASLPSATVSSLTSAAVAEIAAAPMASTRGTALPARAAQQVTSAGTVGSTMPDCSVDSSDDRPSRTVIEDELPATQEPGSLKVRLSGSQSKKSRHVHQKATQPVNSDMSAGRGNDDDDDFDKFFAAVDLASAQHQAPDSDDTNRRQSKSHLENRLSSKPAKKRMELAVSVDASCGAQCDQPSTNRRGSPQRDRVPAVTTPPPPPPHRLCDLGPYSYLIREGNDNDWLSCGVERRSGELEQDQVRLSGNRNETTNLEAAPILPSNYGPMSIPFEKSWEQQRAAPAAVDQQKKTRGFGMFMSGGNCDALLAIDALLEEDDDDNDDVVDEAVVEPVDPTQGRPAANRAAGVW